MEKTAVWTAGDYGGAGGDFGFLGD